MARTIDWNKLAHMHDIPSPDQAMQVYEDSRDSRRALRAREYSHIPFDWQPQVVVDQPLTVYPSELLPEQPLTADTVNNPVVEAQEARNDGTIPLREQVLSSTPPRPKLRVDVADDGSLHVNTSDSGMEPTNHARSRRVAEATKKLAKNAAPAKNKRPPFALYGWNNDPIGYWKNKQTNNIRASSEVKTEALHAALTHGIIRKMPAGAKQEWQSAHHVHTHEHHRQPRTETTPPAKSRLGGKPRAVTFSAPDAQAQNATANTDPVSTIARPLTFPSPAAAPSTRPAAIADQQSSQAHAAVPRDIVPDVPSAALKADKAVQVPEDLLADQAAMGARPHTPVAAAPLGSTPGTPRRPAAPTQEVAASVRNDADRQRHADGGERAEDTTEDSDSDDDDSNSVIERLISVPRPATSNRWLTEYRASFKPWTAAEAKKKLRKKKKAVAKVAAVAPSTAPAVTAAHHPQVRQFNREPLVEILQRAEEDSYRRRYA